MNECLDAPEGLVGLRLRELSKAKADTWGLFLSWLRAGNLPWERDAEENAFPLLWSWIFGAVCTEQLSMQLLFGASRKG